MQGPGPAEARANRRAVLLSAADTVVIVTAYYLLPVFADAGGDWAWLRTLGFGTGLVALGALFTRQVQTFGRDGDSRRRNGQLLLVGVVLTAVLFALCYYSIARSSPGSFAGLGTKTDGLYFSLTVLVTVGFGDVHAVSQVARAVVCVQMVFDVAFIASALTAFRATRSHVPNKSEDHSSQ